MSLYIVPYTTYASHEALKYVCNSVQGWLIIILDNVKVCAWMKGFLTLEVVYEQKFFFYDKEQMKKKQWFIKILDMRSLNFSFLVLHWKWLESRDCYARRGRTAPWPPSFSLYFSVIGSSPFPHLMFLWSKAGLLIICCPWVVWMSGCWYPPNFGRSSAAWCGLAPSLFTWSHFSPVMPYRYYHFLCLSWCEKHWLKIWFAQNIIVHLEYTNLIAHISGNNSYK